jgi:uncharacterized membrane protein (UPF0182 family)
MRIVQSIIILLIIIVALFGAVLNLFADWLWFSSLGYDSVFITMLFTNIWLGVLFFLVTFVFLYINIRVARSRSHGKRQRKKRGPENAIFTLFALLVSFFVGSAFANWEVVLKFLNSVQFGILDPVFKADIGFYVFQLPFYGYIVSYFSALLVLSIVFSLLAYIVYSGHVKKKQADSVEDVMIQAVPTYTIDLSPLKNKATVHLSILFFLLFLAIGFGLWINQYGILFSESGVVFGAGFTDLNIYLPLIVLLSVLSVVMAFVFLSNIKLRRWRLPIEGIIILIGVAVLGIIIAGVVQGFIVKPNEFNNEKPYITRNIENTLNAYGLDVIEEVSFPIEYDLTSESIANNRATIDNIRLWDWRPLIKTYHQLQLFRTYYEFPDIDIDRYQLGDEYKQVMLSSREMRTENLDSNARTWVNEHLVFTHGYGIVMNPVERVSEEGLPEFMIKDIPPKSDFITISRPEIYYGDGDMDYAAVRTTTEELDYPAGEKNIFSVYNGTGGVGIGSLLSRLAYAAKLGSIELLVSGSMKPESRILLNRNVRERADEIAPFLLYDSDPYIVASGGKLYWILDAYTISGAYPYSEPVWLRGVGSVNYIRNSVKVIVDAYNGDVTYYVIDSTDPIISVYMKIFPELFVDFSEMDGDLKSHIRYPEDLFTIQKEVYSTYHMRDPNVFYNREDIWVTPYEILRGQKQEMIPYYIIMRLPGQETEEFILMVPFTPRGKDNLVAWMAAKSDFPNYGNITVFAFSKQELAFGPLQIEARIDQDTDISQLFTLWSQSGSSVVRGNTLVIPIEDSIIYVEPVYLEATEKGTIPELKRVIVAYENRVVMRDTLEEALEAIFGEAVEPTTPGDGPPIPVIPETPEEVLNEVKELYQKAQDALTDGNFALYAQYIDEIGEILEDQ